MSIKNSDEWLDHWNRRFPHVIETLKLIEGTISESVVLDSNFQRLRNSIIRIHIIDILDTLEQRVFETERDFYMAVQSIVESISESINVLYPFLNNEFSRKTNSIPRYPLLSWVEEKAPRNRGRPVNPNSISSIIQSQDGMVVMIEKCLLVYKRHGKEATNTQLAQALQNKFPLPDDLTSITRQMTPKKQGDVIALVKDVAKKLREKATQSAG
jgi:hypothetical protein